MESEHLKANKSDGDVGLVSNDRIRCYENFQAQLGLLLTTILTHT